ncbi:magnesium transporter CorA [Actinoplanes lobatus]|uniref:Magnesium transporter n=1 Tax=Actinoplanes lobatus TaxID=113568 RepID=A0A7W7HE45_9ACTN|nr:magnesium and cobalt transport protein CorA [Actinoplanes lobatus]MBB4748868.1 magnesium transporter [Actinoplanes lobatus]GGN67764.1 magnesium transporter CorA [Actinoplanes lobatus]GIE37224.1 magnesium transporter CorA [Actinoplanes lobatus]
MLGRSEDSAERRRLVRPPRLGDLPHAIGRLLGSIARPVPVAGPVPRGGNPDAVVDCAIYANGLRRGGSAPVSYPEAARQARRRRGAFLWLGLHEPDLATMRPVAEVFGLHELLVEQAVAGGHRPGVQTLGEVTRLVLRTARYVEHDRLTATSEVVETGDVTVLIGPWFAITVRHGPVGPLWAVRKELEARPEVLRQGPWSVAYAVGSRMVDSYLDVAEHVERDLERIEEETFASVRTDEFAHIYQLKREMVEFKRAVLPLAEPLTRLLESRVLPTGLRPYLEDVRGRLARAADRVGGFDDLVNSILQARLAQVSVDQNHDMRKIAAWAAIAAVPTVIAGVFGMNFDVMPGTGAKWGFYVSIAAMLLIGGGVYHRLKKSGWL